MYKKSTFFLFRKNNISVIERKGGKNLYFYNENFYFLLKINKNTTYFFEKYSNFFILYFLHHNV